MIVKESFVFGAIYGRRSVRRFRAGKAVEKDKIMKLLKAAMAAPSACNIQPWDFIVVDDTSVIDGIKASIENYGDYNVPLIIVVTGSNDFIPWKDHGIIDCACAMENMMIAAPVLGLGTVCVGGFNRKKVKEILGIPEEAEAIGMLYVGYPDEKKRARTKFLPEAVHWNSFDTGREKKARPGNIIEFGPEASI